MTVPMYCRRRAARARSSAAARGGPAGATGGHSARFLRSPIFLSAVLGLALRIVASLPPASLPCLLPAIGGDLGKCLEYLGQGTTPLVLLALGVALRPGAVRGRPGPLLLACAVQAAGLPAAVWGLCRVLGIGGDARLDGVLEAAMPTAVMASVLAGQNDMEGDFAVGVVFGSTVCPPSPFPCC